MNESKLAEDSDSNGEEDGSKDENEIVPAKSDDEGQQEEEEATEQCAGLKPPSF